ncbi:hypothetical protein UVI_02057190 [Ustilaginoidea virens]|uniref:Uncharacterized protein n=1 Tax=Ustilaginoidea virens TaxID=1159556 RepID=A0A1B5L1E1_USTVR|nr:hypothetical protein UVI_02057190 [Ustilaginoidea virens]
MDQMGQIDQMVTRLTRAAGGWGFSRMGPTGRQAPEAGS